MHNYICPWKNEYGPLTKHLWCPSIYPLPSISLLMAFFYTYQSHCLMRTKGLLTVSINMVRIEGRITLIRFFRGEWKETREDVPQFLHLIFGKPCGCVTLGCLKLAWQGRGPHHNWQEPAGPARPPGPSPHTHLKQKLPLLLSPNRNPFLCLTMHILFFQHMS